jgi:hypothetical protein
LDLKPRNKKTEIFQTELMNLSQSQDDLQNLQLKRRTKTTTTGTTTLRKQQE